MSIAPPTQAPDDTKLTRREWGLLAVLAAVNCTEITDALLVTPLAQKLQTDIGISLEQYTFIASVYGFAAGVFGIFSSAVVDKFCRKRVLLVAFAGLIISIHLSGLAFDFTTLFVARLFAGALGGLTTCASLAVVGDLIPEKRRGAALGILGSSFAFAAVIGLPGSFAATLLSGMIWPSFAVIGWAGLLVWVWAIWKLPTVREHCHRPRASALRELWRVLANGNHLVAFAFMLCVGLGTYCVIPLMAQYMELNCGVPKDAFAVIFLVMGLCSLGAALLAGKLTDRFGRRPVFVAMIMLTATITLVVSNLPPVAVVVAGAVAAAFMSAAVGRLVPTHAIMLGAAKPETRGAYTTVYNSVSLFGTSLGPLIAGQIASVDGETGQMVNYQTAGFVGVGFSLVGLVLAFLVKPAKQG